MNISKEMADQLKKQKNQRKEWEKGNKKYREEYNKRADRKLRAHQRT